MTCHLNLRSHHLHVPAAPPAHPPEAAPLTGGGARSPVIDVNALAREMLSLSLRDGAS